jgi:hypothetical protein
VYQVYLESNKYQRHKRCEMADYYSNSIEIRAIDQVQLNHFIKQIKIPDYWRRDESYSAQEGGSLIKFYTDWVPAFDIYEDLHQIMQRDFEGLRFDATYTAEEEFFAVLYRWVPEYGPAIVIDEKGTPIRFDPEDPYYNYIETTCKSYQELQKPDARLEFLIHMTAGSFWKRRGMTIKHQTIRELLEPGVQENIVDISLKELHLLSNKLVIQCEQINNFTPQEFNQIALCTSCGLVWADKSETVLNCDWCWLKERKKSFPQPKPKVNNFDECDIPF